MSENDGETQDTAPAAPAQSDGPGANEAQEQPAPLREPTYETVEKGAETVTFENKGQTQRE